MSFLRGPTDASAWTMVGLVSSVELENGATSSAMEGVADLVSVSLMVDRSRDDWCYAGIRGK
jgi:hypothetical protein